MPLRRNTERGVFTALATLSAVLYFLYFLHLRADYPTLLPLVDWARYTDEGWYGGAALHQAQTGHWFIRNGFNPAVALPVWPLLLRLWFALTGIGMVAARVLTVLIFGLGNLLLFTLLRPLTGRVLAVAAVLLTLVNPFCYGFDRLAILEPLVATLFLLALWTARQRLAPPGLLRSAATGLLLTALVLTKTTAVLLVPAVLYLLWQTARTHRHDPTDHTHPALVSLSHRIAADRNALLAPLIAGAAAVASWLAYFFLLVRPHHLADFHHLFTVNAGKAHGRILLQVMARAAGDATWMGALVYALTLLLLAASLRYLRELWRIPLFGSAVLALVLPIAFIGWHTWFIPHYYLPCVPPMMIVLTLGLHALSRRAHTSRTLTWRSAHIATNVAVEAAFGLMLVQTLASVLHPQYTWWNAAQDIAARVRTPTTKPDTKFGTQPDTQPATLLAGSGDDIALWTGIHTANPEWPIGGLPALVQQEHPGWYGGYLPWDAERIARMQAMLPLTEVARYTIQPDPDHQQFVLYRVQPHAPLGTVPRKR